MINFSRIIKASVLAATLFAVSNLQAADEFAIWTPKMVIVEDSATKNTIFVSSAGQYNQNILSAFDKSFKKYFPSASDTLDKAKVKDTMAAYIKITRASVYEEQVKGSSVKAYTVPLTASLNFFNMANGEILYSHSFTDISQGELAATGAEKDKQIANWYIKSYDTLFEKLAKEASEKFKPHRLSAKVIGSQNGLLILDKGTDGGIGKDDSLSSQNGQVDILFSTGGYSIGKDEFPKYPTKVGDTLTKTYNGSLDSVKKPKVTLLDIATDKAIENKPTENMLYEFFADKIASSGNFSLVSINKEFYDAKNSIVSKAGVRVLDGKRQVPEYYIRLYYDGPYNYSMPTNVDYAKQAFYNTTACGELVDISGRVFYSNCVADNISDTVSYGKGLAPAARYEVVAKNATLELANKFAKVISFEKIEYKVNNVKGEQIEFEDSKNLLTAGAVVTIYKNIGSVGDKQNVLIPIQEAQILDKQNNKAMAQLDSFGKTSGLSVSSGDVIIEEAVRSSVPSDAKIFSLCGKSTQMDKLNIDSFDNVSRFLIQPNFKYPIYDTIGFEVAIKKNIESSKFERTPSITTPKTQMCLQPVQWVALKSEAPSSSKELKEQTYEITGGIRLYNSDDIKGKTPQTATIVSKKSFETTPVMSVPATDEKSFLRIQILQSVQKNFDKAVSAIQVP